MYAIFLDYVEMSGHIIVLVCNGVLYNINTCHTQCNIHFKTSTVFNTYLFLDGSWFCYRYITIDRMMRHGSGPPGGGSFSQNQNPKRLTSSYTTLLPATISLIRQTVVIVCKHTSFFWSQKKDVREVAVLSHLLIWIHLEHHTLK